MEEWKDIEGYEGIYQVSNEGRVKSLKFGKEKLMKPIFDGSGYMMIELLKNGVANKRKVHKLVAEAFITNPNEYTIVHHIDHNKTNNIAENLEWMSKEKHDGLHNVEKTEKLSKVVYQYTLNGELVKIWNSTRECGRNGFNEGNVASCCRGERKTHKGYIWKYVSN